MTKTLIYCLSLICFYITTPVNAQGSNECDSVFALLPTAKEDTFKVQSLFIATYCYFKRNKIDSAIVMMNDAIALAKKIDEKRGLMFSYFNLSSIYTTQRKFTEAVKNSLLGIKIAEEIEDFSNVAVANDNLSSYYVKLKSYPAAVDAIIKAAKIRGQSLDDNIDLAAVYSSMRKHDEALSIYLKAKEKFEKQNDSVRIGMTAINISEIYLEQNEYGKAINSLNEAICILPIKRVVFRAWAQRNMSLVHLKIAEEKHENKSEITSIKKQLDSSYRYLIKFNKITKEAGPLYKLEQKNAASLNTLYGKYYLLKGAISKGVESKIFYDSAAFFLKKSIEAEKLFDNPNDFEIMNASNELIKLHLLRNEFKQAYELTKFVASLKDSIFNEESKYKIEQVRVEHEVKTAILKERAEKQKLVLESKAKHDKELSDERLRLQQLAAEEKANHELTMLVEKYRHQTVLSQLNMEQEQLVLKERLKGEQAVAIEKERLQRLEAEEMLRHQQALHSEQLRHELAIAEHKRNQDVLVAEEKRKKNIAFLSAALLVCIAGFLMIYFRQRNQKKLAVTKERSLHEATELELRSLRAQLNPHFMFNSLNSIQELIGKEDTEKSQVYLAEFSLLLRMLLDNSTRPFIPLHKEIELLQIYMSLEKLRLPDLEYTIEIDSSLDPQKTMTPNMMLQPYIENAIWHGLSPKSGARKLHISIIKQHDSVVFNVTDNGIGRKRAAELRSTYRKHKSKGMDLLNRRFDLLSRQYGHVIHATVTDLVEEDTPCGTSVEIVLPVSFSEN